MKESIDWPFFLIGCFLFLMHQINCSQPDPTDELEEVSINNKKIDHRNISLDSIVWFRNDEQGKRFFYYDTEKKVDSLEISYKYSPEEKQFLFAGANLISDYLVDSLFHKYSSNKFTNPIFIFVNDTLGPIANEQRWKLAPNQSDWKSITHSRRIRKNKLLQEHQYLYDGKMSSQSIYSYKNGLLATRKTYEITPSDSSLMRWDIFSYDDNNYLESHLEQMYANDRTTILTYRKTIKEHDDAGRLLKEIYLEYDPEEKDSFRVESDLSYRYNAKGVLRYSTTKDRMTSQDKNTTYEYDDRGNCITHHTNRFDIGYRFEKKEFEYDDLNRLVRYSLLNRSSEKEDFRRVTNRTFKYYKATNHIIVEGKSMVNLEAKSNIEYDEYGNLLKFNSPTGKFYIAYQYDYTIPMETVYSEIGDFHQTIKRAEVVNYGLKIIPEKRKNSHAITSETTYKVKDNKYVTTGQKKYYYSIK